MKNLKAQLQTISPQALPGPLYDLLSDMVEELERQDKRIYRVEQDHAATVERLDSALPAMNDRLEARPQ